MKKIIVISILVILVISCRSNYYVTTIQNSNGCFFVINSRDINIIPDSNILPVPYKSLKIKIKKEELFMTFKYYKVSNKVENNFYRYKLGVDSTNKIYIKLLERKSWYSR